MKRFLIVSLLLIALIGSVVASSAQGNKKIRINVVLNTNVTDAIIADLGNYGNIKNVMFSIDAVSMRAAASELATIQNLPYVASANPDAERNNSPVDTVAAEDFVLGLESWDQDVINANDTGYTGNGVYVAVLDTGLTDSWRQYFPQERIAVEYARSFGGGGGEVGNVSVQPNKWEHDADSHGTHVTSSVIGYSLRGTPIQGSAPLSKIIPVKVLGQSGSGWSSVVAAGIEYIGDLKAGPLADSPVVINMSLGGPVLDGVERAAIDYAIEQGVIIVASAGNSGEAGMGYPGAYEPVISVAASGFVGEWLAPSWWLSVVIDVPEVFNAGYHYITDFSSRELAGQDLDVAAPGSWVVGPYNVNNGQTSYYYLGGTSMASPHVAGIVAQMMEKNPELTQGQVEDILEAAAYALPAGCRNIYSPYGPEEVCWEDDASGHGLITADAALAGVPASASSTLDLPPAADQ